MYNKKSSGWAAGTAYKAKQQGHGCHEEVCGTSQRVHEAAAVSQYHLYDIGDNIKNKKYTKYTKHIKYRLRKTDI